MEFRKDDLSLIGTSTDMEIDLSDSDSEKALTGTPKGKSKPKESPVKPEEKQESASAKPSLSQKLAEIELKPKRLSGAARKRLRYLTKKVWKRQRHWRNA